MVFNQWGYELEINSGKEFIEDPYRINYSQTNLVKFITAFDQKVFAVLATKGCGVYCPGTREYTLSSFILDQSDKRNNFATHWVAFGK